MPAHFGYTQCKQKGFTLVELLVTLVVIILLFMLWESVNSKHRLKFQDGSVLNVIGGQSLTWRLEIMNKSKKVLT